MQWQTLLQVYCRDSVDLQVKTRGSALHRCALCANGRRSSCSQYGPLTQNSGASHPSPRCDPNQTGRPGRGTGTGRSTSTHPPPTGPIGPTGRWGTPAGASADHKLGGSWREVILQQPDLGLGLAEATWCPGHRRPSPWDRGAAATGTRCLPHGLTHNEARTCS